MLLVGIAVIAFTLAPAVATPVVPAPDDDSALPPVVWAAVEIAERAGAPVPIDEPLRYTIQFAPDGQAFIGADCNRASASYTIEGDALAITVEMTTMAMCPPDSQADQFFAQLEQTSSFVHEDDGTLLLTGESGMLRLAPQLRDVTWEWRDFRGGDDSRVEPAAPDRYTIQFLPDGKLAIQADCNRARGSYTVDGAEIDLVVGGTTKKMCAADSLMTPFLRDLDAVSSHVFRHGDLYLALPMDAGILHFSARYQAPVATPEAGQG